MNEISPGGLRIGRCELLGALVAVLINLIGALCVPFSTPDSAWFRALEKPWFYPPSALFGIVWTLLFSLMGIAALLLVPYLAWVSFAAVPNYSLRRLN